MLRELAGRPEVGLLGASSYWAGRNLITVQYWRSRRAPRAASPATRRCCTSPPGRRSTGAGAANGDVGIWHETYLVLGGRTSSRLYGNMPEHGLGAALGSEPRGQHGRTSAQDEMGQQDPEYVAT